MSLAIEQAIPKVLAKKKGFWYARRSKNVKNCIVLLFLNLLHFCSSFFSDASSQLP